MRTTKDYCGAPLPDWASVEVLHEEFVNQLKNRLEENDVRQLTHQLRKFGPIHEYSIHDIARVLNTAANRVIAEDSDREHEVRSEFLHVLFNIFKSRGDRTELSPLTETRVFVRVKGGGYRQADVTYFSSAYTGFGEIVKALFTGSDEAFKLTLAG